MPSKRSRGRRYVPLPTARKTAKRSFSLYGPTSLIERLDNFVSDHSLSSRAAALERLLNAFETAEKTVGDPLESETMQTSPLIAKKNSPIIFDLDSWNDGEIQRLERALEACNPTTFAQWQTVTKSVGDRHTLQECQYYAEMKLKYRPKTAEKKRTLRGRKAKDTVLRALVAVEDDRANDFFSSAPKQAEKHIPLVNATDLSGLSTPSSGVSYGSRFVMDISSSISPAPARCLVAESNKSLTMETRSRANLRISRMQPLLQKAVAAKITRTPLTSKTKRPLKEKPATQEQASWTKIRRRSSSVQSLNDDQSYFDGSTA